MAAFPAQVAAGQKAPGEPKNSEQGVDDEKDDVDGLSFLGFSSSPEASAPPPELLSLATDVPQPKPPCHQKLLAASHTSSSLKWQPSPQAPLPYRSCDAFSFSSDSSFNGPSNEEE
ncbi:hypothetical protein H920_06395 [Fukomys damarensis]|uniref:Uncharacterized protein n=1 Tax=Fukomys damarensis TaxID=885580 RepID=A0A091DPN4_FUKDA|nr:hypothetical protein H920_06395 [Fukomys damarensis]